MSTLTLFAVIFGFILVIGGWLTSEYMSVKNAKAAKYLRQELLKLEKENDTLTRLLNDEQSKFTKLNKDYQEAKEAKKAMRELQVEFRGLQNRYTNTQRGLEIIRKTVSSKKYINNSLSKEIGILLAEHLPDAGQQQVKKVEQSQAAFKRIKDGM